jgi:hypothetical protein
MRLQGVVDQAAHRVGYRTQAPPKEEAVIRSYALRWWAKQHPVLDARREVLLCLPDTGARPIERVRYRLHEQLFDDLEVYMDLWNGTGPA